MQIYNIKFLNVRIFFGDSQILQNIKKKPTQGVGFLAFSCWLLAFSLLRPADSYWQAG